ncbi:MAG: SipW-dependent-type signal peptide-containing protein [Clostridia bacterium]|nr:SipW-dependent-type signal peptide-containing protein [Clostridia bacterium]
MKKGMKALLIAVSAILLVAVSVSLTVAYFTSQADVKNTFTVGKVDISLYEEGAEYDNGVYGQTYENIIPGGSYNKAPTVTVEKGSVESYVRMMVNVVFENAMDEAQLGDSLDGIFSGVDAKWTLAGKTVSADNTSVVYEYRYNSTVEALDEAVELEALFTEIVIPGEWEEADLNGFNNMQINVEGHAIQAFGFADANEAWANF